MCNPTQVMRHQDEVNGLELASVERQFHDLLNERADLTIAMMLLHKTTKENRARFVAINAEMHKLGGKLKQLHKLIGDVDYVLPGSQP